MSEFMFLFKGGRAVSRDISPEIAKAQMEKWGQWQEELRKQNRFVGSDRLVIERKTVASKTMVTDGPYAEGKEIVGGYMIILAKDLDEAVELSKDCPIFEYNGVVEVAEILKMEM